MAFVRLQVLPRWGGDGAGNVTPLFVEQAFGRVTLIEGRELFVSGRQVRFRVRHRVPRELVGLPNRDHAVAVRALHDRHGAGGQGVLSPADRAAVVGAQPQHRRHQRLELRRGAAADRREPDRRAAGVGALRLRAESAAACRSSWGRAACAGPRNDQFDRSALLEMFGFDARLYVAGLSLSGEYVHVDEEEGAGGKQTGAGGYLIASEFYAQGLLGPGRLRADAGRAARCARSPRTSATSGATPGSRASARSRSRASRRGCASSCGGR